MNKNNKSYQKRNSFSIFIILASLALNACGTIYSVPLERREAAYNPQTEASIIIATIGKRRITKLRDTKSGVYTAFYTFVPAAGTNSV